LSVFHCGATAKRQSFTERSHELGCTAAISVADRPQSKQCFTETLPTSALVTAVPRMMQRLSVLSDKAKSIV
jgi:hypothetical protein